jgi:hypothetical protein
VALAVSTFAAPESEVGPSDTVAPPEFTEHGSLWISETLGGLRRERLIALGEHDPRLLTPNPKVLSRVQPRGVVQGSGPHSVQAVTGLAGAKKPATTLWANPTNLHPTAIGNGLQRLRFFSCEAKPRNGESD